MWRLPRAIVPIYGTTLVDTLGYTLMIPLLPVVVRDYHVSVAMVGLLLSIPALCSAIAAPIRGKFSDRLGRKPILMISQGLSLAGYVLLATTHSIVWIMISRVISGCGGGGLGAAQSYVADVTEPEQRDTAFSLYGAVFGMAFVIGPAAAGFLMKGGLAIPFYTAAALELVTIGLTALFIPAKVHQRSKTSFVQSLRAANETGVRVVLVRQFLAILAIVCFLANFSLFLDRVLHSSPAHASWLLSIAGAVGGAALIFLVSPLAGRIGDRLVAQIGLVLSIVAYAMLGFTTGWISFCVALVLWAVGSAMVEPTLTALLSQRAKAEERGAIMGLSDSVNSLAMIVGPAAGSAIVALNPRYLGVLPALAALAAVFVGRPKEDLRKLGGEIDQLVGRKDAAPPARSRSSR